MDSTEQTPAPPHAPASSEGSEDAAGQAPVATERQKAITGDPGFGEQQPRQVPADPDAVHATSAPPPGAQSGTPLPQDRAAAADEAEGSEEGSEGEPDEPGSPGEA